MRSFCLCGMLAVALASNAGAAAFQVVDPRDPTAINGSVVTTPTLNKGTLPTVIYGTGVAPQLRSFWGTRTVESKIAETRTVETSTVDRKVLPMVTRETKRAETSDQIHSTTTVESKSASITDHRIRPFTREGTEELKNQLRKTP